MTSSQQNTFPSQISTNSLFSHHQSLTQKLARKVFHPLKLSPLFELSLIFIQCFQLFSELLLQTNRWDNTLDFSSEKNLIEPILLFAKILSPGWLLNFTTRTELSWCIVGFMVILCVIKVSLIIYAVTYATKRAPFNKRLIALVNWEFHTLAPVTFFGAVSVFSRMVLLAWEDNINEGGINKLACTIGSSLLGILRTGIVIGLILLLTNLLPNRSLLAVNSKSVDLVIVVHKIALLILQFLPQEGKMWAVTLTSLFFCGISLYLHFTRFVSQNIQGLYFKGYLLALVALLNVILVIRAIVVSKSPVNRFGVDTTLLVFGVLSPVVGYLVKSFLDGKLLEILAKENESSPEKMLYKISVMKYFDKTLTKRKANNPMPNDLAYLLSISGTLSLEKIFGMTDKVPIKSQIITKYLESLCEKFPQNDLIKLHTAYYHGKKLQNFEHAIKLLTKIENRKNQNISMSVCLLKRDLENSLKKTNEISSPTQIDLKSFVHSKMAFSKLQNKVFKQIDLQTKIYQEYIKDQADVSVIYDMSQKLVLQRKMLNKEILSISKNFPEGYLDPYFFLQGYYLTAQHSIRDYNKSSKILNQKIVKLQKSLTSLHINADNLYDPKNVSLVISGHKENLGQIQYCSNSALTMLGWGPGALTGKNISMIFPSILQKSFVDLIEGSTTNFAENVFQAFVRHREGYIIEVDLCLGIHPLMHQGFLFDVVLRPIFQSKRDLLILNEIGEIEGFTKRIGKKLGLLGLGKKKNGVELGNLSKRLAKMNSSRKNKDSDEDVVLMDSLGYSCKIEERNYCNIVLKICILEEEEEDLAYQNHRKTEILISECSENFNEMEEKQENNINIEQYHFNSRPLSRNTEAEDQPEKITTGQDPFMTSHRELLKSTRNSSNNLEQSPRKFKPVRDKIDDGASSFRSRSSQKSNYWRISSSYQAALKTKYYPKDVIWMIWLMLAIFTIILALQINCQVEMGENFEEISEKKDVIEAAQVRNYYLLRLQGIAKYEVYLLKLYKQFNYIPSDVSAHPIIQLGSSILLQSNSKLLQATGFLESNEDRERLFERNVRIYDDPDNATNYMNMTNFEAAGAIAETVARGIGQIWANNLTEAIVSMNFLLKNSLNDLLLTSERTVSIFLNSLKIFRSETENFLLTKYYVGLGLLLMIQVIGVLLLRVQFVRIKKNMLAFANLDLEIVKELLENLIEFRNSVMKGEGNLDDLESEDLNQRQYRLVLDPKSLAKKIIREVKLQAITRKYILYGLKLAIFIGLLMAILSGYKVVLKRRITEVHEKVSQVYYSSWILSQTYLCYSSLAEIFSVDNSRMIRNQPAYDQAVESMEQVQGVIHEISRGLFSNDGDSSYDPQVFKLLFENTCPKEGAETGLSYFCGLPKNVGKTVNFLNIISNIEYNTNQILRDYHASNKSVAVLNKLIGQINSEVGPSVTAEEILNLELTARLSFLFEERAESAVNQNRKIGIWSDIGIVLIAGLAWLLIFRRVKEVDNEFKNVLSVFPVNLVLSNFKLKSYLKETSREVFSIVR